MRLNLGDVVHVLGLDDAFGAILQKLGEVVLRTMNDDAEAGK